MRWFVPQREIFIIREFSDTAAVLACGNRNSIAQRNRMRYIQRSCPSGIRFRDAWGDIRYLQKHTHFRKERREHVTPRRRCNRVVFPD